jgi:Ca2+-binding RTX toxin-like protein
VLTGPDDIDGTGNDLANMLNGNGGQNVLDGGDGNDTLIGGLNSDRMIGGLGNDVFVVDDSGDLVIEAADQGYDRVDSSVSFTLGDNIERLNLLGSDNLNGTGNGLSNVLVGNAGNNMLDGAEGNDTLNGGLGADTMTGGLGNDVFAVDDAGDVAIESADQGYDRVDSSVSFTLGANIERLNLLGAGDLNGTGNGLANVLVGNAGNNMLDGGDGNDTLNGGLGADTMTGGLGNDVFTVDNTGDVIVELAGGGIDRVDSSVTYTLSDQVDRLTLTGADAIDGTGNSLNNILLGNGNANRLDGAGGNDSLNGGAGSDTLIGGLGNDTQTGGSGDDTFVFVAGSGRDVVTDFQAGAASGDVVSLSFGTAFDTYAEVMAAAVQVGANVVITFDAATSMTLQNTLKANLTVDDFTFF